MRGLGIREPMFNANVHRPIGTGGWLTMFFHQATRLDRRKAEPSVGPNTLIIWPPGAEQFYNWGKAADDEPHSWIYIQGIWVAEQIEESCLRTATPLTVDDEALMTGTLNGLMDEMTQNQ